MLQVELRPPYGLANCSTENSTDLATLERVKKVVRALDLVFWNLAYTCQINGLIAKTWLAVDGGKTTAWVDMMRVEKSMRDTPWCRQLSFDVLTNTASTVKRHLCMWYLNPGRELDLLFCACLHKEGCARQCGTQQLS